MRFAAITLLFLTAILPAKDVYQPVKKDALEVGVGFGYAAVPGVYDAQGNYRNWSELFGGDTAYYPTLSGIPLRAKYGIGSGVDLRVDWDAVFSNEDAGNLKGMSQPKIGLRYTAPKAGLFTNLTLPFATGNLYNGNLATYLEVGGLLRFKRDRWRATTLLSYTEVTDRGNIVRASVRPDISWGKRRISTYTTMEYSRSLSTRAYLVTLSPGVRTDLTPALTVDMSAPFTLHGQSAPAGWSVKAIFYRTLGR